MYTYCYSARPSYGWASHVVVWGVSVLAAATLASIPKGPGKCVCVCTCMREGGGKHTKIVFFFCFFPLETVCSGVVSQTATQVCKLRHYANLIGSELASVVPTSALPKLWELYKSVFFQVLESQLVKHPMCRENYH